MPSAATVRSGFVISVFLALFVYVFQYLPVVARMYHETLLIIIILVCLGSYWMFRSRSIRETTGPYGTAHSLLNYPDSTLWQNMGLWTEGCTFREACENLTDEVASSIGPLDTVLDFGYGCGEEIKYIAEKYKPQSIQGCTSHRGQNEVARHLCRTFDSVTLDHGDALEWCLKFQGEPVTRVIAIDTVYHFDTRLKFLRALTSSCMEADSKLSLADIILSDEFERVSGLDWSWHSLHPLFLVLRLLSVPLQNMKTRAAYIRDFEAVGFTDIHVHSKTPKVFPGLANHIESHSDWRRDKRWIGFLIFAKILQWWSNNRYLEFVVVSATLSRQKESSRRKK